jgi:hypothetical protein
MEDIALIGATLRATFRVASLCDLWADLTPGKLPGGLNNCCQISPFGVGAFH